MCVCARPVRCAVYTARRVQGSCHCLDAKSRKKDNFKSTTGAFVEIVLLFLSAMIDFLRLESVLSHLATFQTTHCLSIRVDASPKSRRTRSTRMNLVFKKKRMSAEVVLLQKNLPHYCLATQDTFALKDFNFWDESNSAILSYLLVHINQCFLVVVVEVALAFLR